MEQEDADEADEDEDEAGDV
ncbi:hypothetical protein A2U01_0090412, partial [Trifolium medium]|nr:hypothetical protein [Trifolium medium]